MNAPAPVEYKKLPGSGISRKGSALVSVARISSRLWLGDDHLLQVESSGGYSETYKRFYFRDIQAFCLRRTKNWFAANVVLGFLTAVFLLWTLAVSEVGGKVALGIFSGAFAVCLLINLLRGPTCTCHVKTAVHYEELPSLRRLRNAEKVLARLGPSIEAAQGATASETLAQQYSSVLSSAQATPASPGHPGHLVDPNLTAYNSRAHRSLFITLLAMMVADALYLILPSVLTVVLNMLVTAALAIFVLWALVKQTGTDLKPTVRGVTWAACVYTALSYISGYIAMFIIIPGEHLDGTQWGYIKALARMNPLESTGWLATIIASASISGILGILGLLLLRQHLREKNSMS